MRAIKQKKVTELIPSSPYPRDVALVSEQRVSFLRENRQSRSERDLRARLEERVGEISAWNPFTISPAINYRAAGAKGETEVEIDRGPVEFG